jgi:hypothetical protein
MANLKQSADTDRLRRAVAADWEMRTGRKLGRTLYLHDPQDDPDVDICVGIVDDYALAEEIVRRWNHAHFRRLPA